MGNALAECRQDAGKQTKCFKHTEQVRSLLIYWVNKKFVENQANQGTSDTAMSKINAGTRKIFVFMKLTFQFYFRNTSKKKNR